MKKTNPIPEAQTGTELFTALASLGLDTPAQQLFLKHCTFRRLTSNTLIFETGQKNNCEYFLVEGVLHRFNMHENGKQVTTDFYSGCSVVTPHFARTHKGRSIFSLQALTEVTIGHIAVKEFDRLRYNDPSFRNFGQAVIEAALLKQTQQDVAFRSTAARERLLHLRHTFPNLENRIPLQAIASYLGITNVSLSRLRNELSKK